MMACVTGWFETHRSPAVSLVSAGMGMAPMTMSPLAARLISNHDWRTSLQILAVLTAVIMIPVALLVRRPPALNPENVLATHEKPQSGITLRQAIRSPQFITLLLTNFFCCATHSGPIIQ
jgi:predicted MFS family arabinose efflux permease